MSRWKERILSSSQLSTGPGRPLFLLAHCRPHPPAPHSPFPLLPPLFDFSYLPVTVSALEPPPPGGKAARKGLCKEHRHLPAPLPGPRTGRKGQPEAPTTAGSSGLGLLWAFSNDFIIVFGAISQNPDTPIF